MTPDELKQARITEYEARKQAKITRLENAATRLDQQSQSRLNTAHDMAQAIPFGQPILVGHYSEGRDRNYRGRIDSNFRKGLELHDKAAELRSRAESAASNKAIFSDDPQAAEKLADKIARLEQRAELKARPLIASFGTPRRLRRGS